MQILPRWPVLFDARLCAGDIMRAVLYVAVVTFSTLCLAQNPAYSDKALLRSLSSEQLKKCLDDPKLCGRKDYEEISEELVRRLPRCHHNNS